MRSISATLARRRTWRSSSETRAARKATTISRRHLDADHPAAQAQHVDVVVLDALMGGVGVMDGGGADPADLAGGDRHAGARAAHDDAALRPGPRRRRGRPRAPCRGSRSGPADRCRSPGPRARRRRSRQQPVAQHVPGMVKAAGDDHRRHLRWATGESESARARGRRAAPRPARRPARRGGRGGSSSRCPGRAGRSRRRRAGRARAAGRRPGAAPPPITTSSGSKVLIALAMPIPTPLAPQLDQPRGVGIAVLGGLHGVARRSALAVCAQPAERRVGMLAANSCASPSSAWPAATRLQRARLRELARGRHRPLEVHADERVAELAGAAGGAAVDPPAEHQPAADARCRWSASRGRARPVCSSSSWASASAATVASLSTNTGTPSRSPSTSRSGTSASGMLTEETTRPVSKSTTEGTPIPTPSRSVAAALARTIATS